MSTYSTGLATVFRALTLPPRHDSTRAFPPGYTVSRIPDGRRITKQFPEIVNRVCNGDVERCRIDERMAIFAQVRGTQQNLKYVNCQVLIVNKKEDLDDIYLERHRPYDLHYLRLDYDPSEPGPLFKEPAPHVHIRPDGEPRFLLTESHNIVVEFFDFIYRNYFHSMWQRWAFQAWRATASGPVEQDPFNSIAAAFTNGRWTDVHPHRAAFDQMKAVWQGERDRMYTARTAPEVRALLSLNPPHQYPVGG